MSEPGNFDDRREEAEKMDTPVDPYTTESSADIYTTPAVSLDTTGMTADEISQNTAVTDTHGLFSGSGQSNDPYYNTVPGVNPYGSGQPVQGAGSYQYSPYNQQGTAYGPGGYNGSPYNAENTYNQNPYGSPYNNANPYGGQQANGGYGGQPPYGAAPFGENPYSPYAAPQKKGHTGLIITIVVIIILLFIVAVCALVYRAVEMIDENDFDRDEIIHSDKYDFDDDYEYHHDDEDDFYGYDDDYDYDYDYDEEDDRYYSFQDDIRYDLSYQVDFDFYEYETDDEDVSIMVTYPIVVGEEVQNLDKINETIYGEVELITEYFEEEYAPYMKNNEDSYFSATAFCYVTYMDEDKLSVVFQESIYADTYDLAYLECINIDMANGVILDNEEMLSIDDDFSVEFRTRSDEQNGKIYSLTNMTDQEITSYFNSSDVIVFYTPKGMEIGFNYEDGWVTVTYEEYEQYLNVF